MKVRSILSYCLLALTASASQIGLKDAKLSLITSDGSTEKVYSLQPPTPAISSDSPPIALESDHILRLSFLTTGLDEGVTLKQNHIQFKDISSGAVTNLPIAIKRNGLGKFDLKVSSLPSSLRKTSGTLSLRLLLASSSSSIKPLSYQIASISLPKNKLSPPPVGRHDISKASPEEGKPAFKALPEIKHTFGTPEKEVGGVISAIGTVVVLAPWVGLAYLLSGVSKNLSLSSPPTSSILLLASLTGLEGLILKYWVNWKLYQFLPPFAALSLVTFYIGRVALRQMQLQRLSGTKIE